MGRDLVRIKPLTSSFLSCEKDVEIILRKLFIESKPYSDELKKLLVINMPDCLDEQNSQVYNNKIHRMTPAILVKEGYIRLSPKLMQEEFQEVKNYLLIDFDNFTPNATNPQFRDCIISITALCNLDQWELGDYRQRPLKICGYIDGLLNNTKLTGIGILNFLGCKELVLDETLSGYTLMYRAVHGSDDIIPREDEDE